MAGAGKATGGRQGAKRVSAIGLALALLAGCTSIGLHSPKVRRQLDFGAPDAVRLCLYLDAGISARKARLLIDEAWRDEAPIVRWASLNQLISSPRQVVRHELYHLLGCDHHFRMHRCYEQIARLKAVKRANVSEFFPAWDLINRRVLASRDAVNEALSASRVSTAATSR